jgi:hypothetical protein
VANLRRWLANLVARLLATATLLVRIHRSFKNKKMGDISKGVANKLAKKIYKKSYLKNLFPLFSILFN